MSIGDEVQECPIEARAVAEHARRGTARDAQLDRLVPALREGADRSNRRFSQLGGVERTKLESDRAGSIAGEIEDLADEVLHPLRVALHRLEHRAALLVRRIRCWVEQQPGERSHHRDRRPELMGDDRQEVGPHPLQVLQGHRGLSPVAVLDQAPSETREDIPADRRPRGDADEAERFKLAQQVLHDAWPNFGAVLGEPALEIR